MPSALIGYTGFVGSNLLRQTHFDDLYNSKNIEDIRGKKYDLVVCAAPRADKWWVNANPEKDFAAIHYMFFRGIEAVRARRFIHISTIDVYSNPVGVDEDSAAGGSGVSAYGENRHWLEGLIRVRFPHAQIIRLPGLFGPGLKKNLIYDLIHKQYEFLPHPDSTFQFYDINNLSRDMYAAIPYAEVPLVNLVTEPVSAQAVADVIGLPPETLAIKKGPTHYDVRSRVNPNHQSPKGYFYPAAHVLRHIKDFAKNETRSL